MPVTKKQVDAQLMPKDIAHDFFGRITTSDYDELEWLASIPSAEYNASSSKMSIWDYVEKPQRRKFNQATVYSQSWFLEQPSSNVVDYELVLLEKEARQKDAQAFQKLVNDITWADQPVVNIVRAIYLALNLEDVLTARKLSELGNERYPNNSKIRKICQVLAPPTITKTSTSSIDIRANNNWIRENRETYKYKWVALYNGRLLAVSHTFLDLSKKVGHVKGTGILLTQVS